MMSSLTCDVKVQGVEGEVEYNSWLVQNTAKSKGIEVLDGLARLTGNLECDRILHTRVETMFLPVTNLDNAWFESALPDHLADFERKFWELRE
jgi:hypothetical protein